MVPSNFAEDLDKESLGPFEYPLKTATQKCLSVYEDLVANTPASVADPALVIAGDTVIVTAAGLILEKPRNERDHIAMLKMLRDQKVHKVYSAVVVVAPREDCRHPGYNIASKVVETIMNMDPEASDELIEAYVRTRDGVDKAGGYSVQGLGGLLIDGVEGSWDNAIGISLKTTLALIEEVIFKQNVGDSDEGEEEDEET